MVTDGTVPTLGLWYDFRQKPPLGDYASFYSECFVKPDEVAEGLTRLHEQALESMRLFASEATPGVRDAVKA